ncbi:MULTISPECIES: TetR/AcrR family transcriptional regulator [Burkholderia]|nr:MULTISPECIES: TetR/AcrR family transcriptional regulator [Burkholderia]
MNRAETRKCLISAARKVFVTRGFSVASIEEISREAGKTRGAFYSNFKAKTELLMELLCEDRIRALDFFRNRSDLEKNGTNSESASFVRFILSVDFEDHLLLWMEGHLLAAHDPEFGVRYWKMVQELFSEILGASDGFCVNSRNITYVALCHLMREVAASQNPAASPGYL